MAKSTPKLDLVVHYLILGEYRSTGANRYMCSFTSFDDAMKWMAPKIWEELEVVESSIYDDHSDMADAWRLVSECRQALQREQYNLAFARITMWPLAKRSKYKWVLKKFPHFPEV